jgi:hypothetical protein
VFISLSSSSDSEKSDSKKMGRKTKVKITNSIIYPRKINFRKTPKNFLTGHFFEKILPKRVFIIKLSSLGD